MDETTSNFYTDGTYTWDNDTTSTAAVTTWITNFEFTSWDPYLFKKYTPKWHIDKGYKYQIKHMWD